MELMPSEVKLGGYAVRMPGSASTVLRDSIAVLKCVSREPIEKDTDVITMTHTERKRRETKQTSLKDTAAHHADDVHCAEVTCACLHVCLFHSCSSSFTSLRSHPTRISPTHTGRLDLKTFTRCKFYSTQVWQPFGACRESCECGM